MIDVSIEPFSIIGISVRTTNENNQAAEDQEIWQMELGRAFTSDFEVYGEKAQNPADAEVDILIAVSSS